MEAGEVVVGWSLAVVGAGGKGEDVSVMWNSSHSSGTVGRQNQNGKPPVAEWEKQRQCQWWRRWMRETGSRSLNATRKELDP